jgi:gamma-glutamyl-gamma-aminobutyrate hydrolase PuuD
MKKILITQNIEFNRDRIEYRDSLDQRLNKFFLAAGYFLMPIPNLDLKQSSKNSEVLIDLFSTSHIDGIVLSGGNDIGLYESRDKLEEFLIGLALDRKIPLLGICRGMQMLATYGGSRLIQVPNHASVRHKIIGESIRIVNSFHNYGLQDCPKNFRITYKSEDGNIEAIDHKDLSISGIMWHPERNEEFDALDLQLVKRLFR